MNVLAPTFTAFLSRYLRFVPQKILSAISVVITAQFATIPIMLSSFGQFSIISVMVNLLFVPVVSVIFTATLLCTVIGGIFGIETITLFLINHVFKAVNVGISIFDNNLFMIGGFSLGGGWIAYYLALAVVGGTVNVKGRIKAITTIALVATFLINSIVISVVDYNAIKLYACGADDVCVTLAVTPQGNTLFVSDTNKIYSAGRIKRLSLSSGQTNLNTLVFMGGYDVDMQVFITKLYTVFDIERVAYYGEKDEMMEKIVKQAIGARVENFVDGDKLPVKGIDARFTLNGNAVDAVMNGKRAIIFSAFDKGTEDLRALEGEFDYMFALTGADSVLNRFKPKRAISYRYSRLYENAEINGNVVVKIT
jgi:hypothetical protein